MKLKFSSKEHLVYLPNVFVNLLKTIPLKMPFIHIAFYITLHYAFYYEFLNLNLFECYFESRGQLFWYHNGGGGPH